MSPADESELRRLCGLIAEADRALPATSPTREALQKAALALHSAFTFGARVEIEESYAEIGRPLSDAQRANLLAMGIEPDEPPPTNT
jgi:hypothetical protein